MTRSLRTLLLASLIVGCNTHETSTAYRGPARLAPEPHKLRALTTPEMDEPAVERDETRADIGVRAPIVVPNRVHKRRHPDTRLRPRVHTPADDDPYAPFDKDDEPVVFDPLPTPKPVARVIVPPAPLPEADHIPPPPPPSGDTGPEYPTPAFAVGAAGLGVAAISFAMSAEDPTSGTLIFGGTMLAIGLGAVAVGGVMYYLEAGDDTTVGVGPTSLVLETSF